MIWCATAFLLITGKSSNGLNRLVVTTDELDKPSYGVYEVKSRSHFPHSEYIDQFMLSKTQIFEKGTYYMSYCSDYLRSAEIASLITEGLTDITQHAHIGLTHDKKEESNCLNYLSSISNLNPDQNVIDLSKCEKKVRRTCTSRTILNLAFTGIIAVDGPYKAFAPQKADQPIVVTQDQPLDMSSLFLNGEIFARSATELEQNALAWYQGHLHLFKQNLRTNEWTPVTLIGSEVKTGSLITNHILKAFPDSELRWMEFYRKKDDVIKAYKPPIRGRNSRYDHDYRQIYDFLNSRERYEDKFVFKYPFFDSNNLKHVYTYEELWRFYFDNGFRILRQLLIYSKNLSHQKLMSSPVKGTMSPFEELEILKP
ncbi:CSEP0455 putative effector protein [Blumeria hordei DH14]|uniref:CSEP0455 putative effector protein n=1 Tax=Blumeria graminis f. sp. hordei (strain DH14) TaxID=546991 RepID=N1JNW0_BLUG1|nr:CSEP0455 putative effector protein [Blumeria hordei DH14]